MTTQAISCSLAGSKGFKGAGTETDGSWNNLTDSNGLELYQTCKTQSISSAVCSYTAGCASFRIYNTENSQVKKLWFGNIITEEETVYFKPVTIAENDVLQVYPLAV